MATKIDFKTLLMKIVNIFPKDMYLVHNWCAIAGDESDKENRGFYFCILEPEVRMMLNKLFPNNPTLYIQSVRDTKVDNTKVQEITDKKELKKIDDIVDNHMLEYGKIESWDTFNFSEKDIDEIFNEGKSFTLFENDDTPSVIISKSMFPLITNKTVNNVKYNYNISDEDATLNQISMCYDYELFQLVMRYLYLSI
jgi:hypothetical protein